MAEDSSVEVLDFEDGCGRRLITRRNLMSGERASVDVPSVFALAPMVRHARCGYCCMYVLGRGVACKCCNDAVFCDATCRELARHDDECELMKDLRGESETMLAAARLMRLGEKGRSIVAGMTKHKDEMDETTRAKWQGCAESLAEVLGDASVDDIFDALCALALNSHAMVDHAPPGRLLLPVEGADAVLVADASGRVSAKRQASSAILECFGDASGLMTGVVFGVMVSLPLAMFNHACSPTAYLGLELRPHEAPLVVLRATRKLEARQQLSCSYLPLKGSTTEQRQTTLQAKYHFACRCRVCSNSALSRRLDDWITNNVASWTSSAPEALDRIYDALLRRDTPAAEYALTATDLIASAGAHQLAVLLAALCIEAHRATVSPLAFDVQPAAPRSVLVHIVRRVFGTLEADADLASLALDPVTLGRAYCVASTCAGATFDESVNWAKRATRLFDVHLGPASLLSRNARTLIDSHDARKSRNLDGGNDDSSSKRRRIQSPQEESQRESPPITVTEIDDTRPPTFTTRFHEPPERHVEEGDGEKEDDDYDENPPAPAAALGDC